MRKKNNAQVMDALVNGKPTNGKIKKLMFNSDSLINNKNTSQCLAATCGWNCPSATTRFSRGLDFPIRKVKGVTEQKMEFMRKLGYNLAWAKEVSDLRDKYCPEVCLLLPIQCYDIDQFDFFYARLQDVKFDGFSLPVRNLNEAQLMQLLIRLHRTGKKIIHVLGTAKYSNIVIMAFMARHFFDWLSFDATNWRVSASYQQYMQTRDLSLLNVSSKSSCPTGNPCCHPPCPCSGMSFQVIQQMDYTDKHKLLETHNHLATVNVANELFNHADTAYSLIQYMGKTCRNAKTVERVRRVLYFVDYVGADESKLRSVERQLTE